jgi:hypothetical protein
VLGITGPSLTCEKEDMGSAENTIKEKTSILNLKNNIIILFLCN